MCVCVCLTVCGPTLFLLGHILRIAFAVSVVALLLPWGLDAAALHFIHLLRQIVCWGHPLHQHLEIDREGERKRERARAIEEERRKRKKTVSPIQYKDNQTKMTGWSTVELLVR